MRILISSRSCSGEVEPQSTYCGGVESQPEGEWPVLIVSQGVRSVPRLAVHGGGEGECARGAAVGVDVGQVRAQNRLGLIDCVAVGDLCRKLSKGDGGKAAPVVREDVTPLTLGAEPEAIPMPDSDLV